MIGYCTSELYDHATTCGECNRVICALQEMLENLSAKCLVRDRFDIVRGPACGAVYQASRWGRQIFAPIAAVATTHVRGPACGDLTGPRAKTAPEIIGGTRGVTQSINTTTNTFVRFAESVVEKLDEKPKRLSQIPSVEMPARRNCQSHHF